MSTAALAMSRDVALPATTPAGASSEGFVRHPAGVPLLCRRRRLRRRAAARRGPGLGLCFDSGRAWRPGTMLELGIPLGEQTEWFEGRVVLLRDWGERFEVGVWIAPLAEATRLRIVEQVCHMQCWAPASGAAAGSAAGRERRAREWIARFAAAFPVPAGLRS